MGNPILTKNRTAEGAITKYRIVKPGTSDGQVVQASANSDDLMAICAELDAADTERVDVHYAGLADVEYGGTVAKGDRLTSDANGKAIAATAGDNVSVIGYADVAGVSGDLGRCLIAPHRTGGAVVQMVDVDNLLGSGAAVYHVPSPVAGKIVGIYSALNVAALATADATITAAIGGTPVTGGVLTIAQSGSAAGDIDSATPSAANTVAAGDDISLTVGGGNTEATAKAKVALLIHTL